jgi:DnaK suppressor protein
MTTISDPSADIDLLRRRLEQEYERHTRQLTDLSTGSSDGSDPWPKAELISGSRQMLADIARALRAMAEDRYGLCIACGDGIPVQRLQVRPQAAYCVPCQRQQQRG